MGNVFVDFLLNKGLYDTQPINEQNFDQLFALMDGKEKIECYCKECGEKRVFTSKPLLHYSPFANNAYTGEMYSTEIQNYQRMNRHGDVSEEYQTGCEWIARSYEYEMQVLTFRFICTLNEEHHLDFVVRVTKDGMMKIGQYPSVADLTFPLLDKYKGLLTKQEIKEMRRAVGLYADGIGIGSYVYLRRVLERLVTSAEEYAIHDGFDNKSLNGCHFGEKVKALRNYLPEMLTANLALYGIISKGIHDMSEEECLSYFPVLRDCIFMILEQQKTEKDRRQRENELTKEISRISSSIR